MYGEEFIVEFIDFIRPDQKYDELDALLAQMKIDCDQIKVRLNQLAKHDPMQAFPLGKLRASGEI